MTDRYGEYEQVNGATVNRALDKVGQLRAENERLRVLLNMATCSICDGSGAIPYGREGEAMQCQWCAERKQALERKEID